MIKIGCYPSSDNTDATPAWVLNRAKEYMENDTIFIPINMDEVHWYLCVINARKLCVQVLDSLGPSMNRKDLTNTVSS
uniref:Ubiquitin-like protease family profile domain-containing protein n=2 Tax=Aegilops tauschii subsp. strangulata TaxID=200361 RepID=A0A452ZWG9_AEGTS